MTETVLSIQGLRAGYGKAEVLHGIDLQAPQGSVITVIGPNGAGKSTFLNALMGVLPAQGHIEFQGRPIGALSLEAWLGARENSGRGAIRQITPPGAVLLGVVA